MLERPAVRLRDVLMQYERLWSADPEAYARSLARLWDALVRDTRDEAIGAHLGAQFTPREHLHSDIILSSSTVRDALERGFAFYNARNAHSSYALERRGSAIGLLVTHRRPPGTIRQDTEKRLALLATLVRWFDPQDRPPVAVRLRAPRPPYDVELQAVFGCAVAYGQDEDAVIVATPTLDARIWGAEHAAQRLRDLSALPATPPGPPATLKERVAAAIGEGLPSGRGGKKHVAPELGMSPRSLERWLAEAGESYRGILEAVRLGRCLELLQIAGLPSRDLAAQLGFSNFSNFRRAFCRWFAPGPQGPAEQSRPAAAPARWRTLPRDGWVAAYGPRPCPFVTKTCDPDCSIHTAKFAAPGKQDSL